MYFMVRMGATLLLTSSAACTAHGNNAQGDIAFSCTVTGLKFAEPALNEAAVCGLFQSKIDKALSRKTISVKLNAAAQANRWIKLDVRTTKLGSIIAIIGELDSGVYTKHPEISVDVSDKAIGQQDVNILATETARVIAKTSKKS